MCIVHGIFYGQVSLFCFFFGFQIETTNKYKLTDYQYIEKLFP